MSMEKNPNDDNQSNDSRPALRGPNLWLLLAAAALVIVVLIGSRAFNDKSEISYSFFMEQLNQQKVVDGKPVTDDDGKPVYDSNIARFVIGEEYGEGEFKTPPADPLDLKKDKPTGKKLLSKFEVTLPHSGEARDRLNQLLQARGVEYKNQSSSNLLFYAVLLLPAGLLLFLWLSYRRSRSDMMGGGFLSGFSKSPAKRYESSNQPITFADVAGLKGVKADLQEIVDFLKSPEKFRRLGGRIPKGVLLNGPPGTGKTLLARAVAGEAGVPFFSVSGSEFIQMFVGVGASRVRDLFKTAKESPAAIIFIDEIDAVGRQRGAGLGGGHDEREQTLNQILSEMDGFNPSDAVIVLAATNRPDVLDPALLRPGRFDRHVTVGRPTQAGRVEIFKVHVRDVPLAEDVDLEQLAAGAIGLTGADIRNIVNEAALWAARTNKSVVEMEDFNYARDKILMGAKREEVLSGKEKETTAYHEAGHTLLAWTLPGAHRVHKVTVIPRGRSLGATQTMPSEERMSMSENELHDHLVMLLGGRAAEKIIYNEMNVGAENDLERATSLARRMVTHWGMTERLGPVSYKMSDEDPFLGREIHQSRQFSEHTMELIDEEVARILHESSDKAIELLTKNRDKLEAIALALVEQEELDENQITELIGDSIHATNAAAKAEIKTKPTTGESGSNAGENGQS